MTQHTNPVPVIQKAIDDWMTGSPKEREQPMADFIAHRLASTPADALSGEAVCANCKGVIGDLAPGREPDELCDTCYDDVTATLRTAADPEPAGAQEVVAWMYERNGVKVFKEVRAANYTSPAMGFTETPLAALAALPQPPADEVK